MEPGSDLLARVATHIARLNANYAPQSQSSILPSSISTSGIITTLPHGPERAKHAPEAVFSESRTSLGLLDTLTHLADHILPGLNQSSISPNYYGFVTGGATPAALAADFMVSIYDQNVAVHLPNESISTVVEVAALNMLVELFRLPKPEWGIGNGSVGEGGLGGGGTFTTGATASNVLGLAMGREYVLGRKAEKFGSRAVSVGEFGLCDAMRAARSERIQVLSTMPHSSVAKAASIVGIGRSNIVSVASSDSFLQIDLDRLEAGAKQEGTASILAISAGEVNTGFFAITSSEQMLRIRKICDRYGVWVHVDGAFGLFGRIFCEEDRDEFEEIVTGTKGLELADSITSDGHKLLNVPYDCGFFFTRHKSLMEEVFRNGSAAYLTSPVSAHSGDDGIPGPLNIGIENSRRFRALPVYATLVAYGRKGYQAMLGRQVRLARRIAAWIFDNAAYELLPKGASREQVTRKTFIIVLFRARDDDLNRELVKKINGTGRMYVSGTKWEEKAAARIAVSNWQADVERDGRIIEDVLEEVLGEQEKS